jgi:hypothetical protein
MPLLLLSPQSPLDHFTYLQRIHIFYQVVPTYMLARGVMTPLGESFPRRRESSPGMAFWTPAFAGVTLELMRERNFGKLQGREGLFQEGFWSHAGQFAPHVFRG